MLSGCGGAARYVKRLAYRGQVQKTEYRRQNIEGGEAEKQVKSQN